MADQYQEELINISERLGKYNQAMQDSLNILSDEFLLLRDELSTLNQNLEKTKGLDEKIDEFNKTAKVFDSLRERLQALEKISESLDIAAKLSDRIDSLKESVDGNKDRMGEIVNPLNKKMDILFSKFDETLSPLSSKLDMSVAALKEEIKETTESLKQEDQIKSLAIAIGEELGKLERTIAENSNSVKSISTSVAYLSSSEGELKKSLDGLVKIYEQDREFAAKERAQKDANERKQASETKDAKLDEIAALLKVQMEQMQKQELILDGLKNSKPQNGQFEEIINEIKKQNAENAKKQTNAEIIAELGRQNEQFAKIQGAIYEQNSLIKELKATMPSGNFEEVIRHADLINQATNAKLDGVLDASNAYTKNAANLNDKLGQLPNLMQNISVALDTLVAEMRKSQSAYKDLEGRVEKVGVVAAAPSQSHLEKLEVISQDIRGLHTKMEPPQNYEIQLKTVIDELKKFELLEQQRLSAIQAPQMPATPSAASDKLDIQLLSIKKELSNVSTNVDLMKAVLTKGADITAEVDFSPILKKIGDLQQQISAIQTQKMEAATSQGPSGAGGSSAISQQNTTLPPDKLFDQREILQEIQQNIQIFEQFELSDRARIVVDRIAMLTKRAMSLYSI